MVLTDISNQLRVGNYRIYSLVTGVHGGGAPPTFPPGYHPGVWCNPGVLWGVLWGDGEGLC